MQDRVADRQARGRAGRSRGGTVARAVGGVAHDRQATRDGLGAELMRPARLRPEAEPASSPAGSRRRAPATRTRVTARLGARGAVRIDHAGPRPMASTGASQSSQISSGRAPPRPPRRSPSSASRPRGGRTGRPGGGRPSGSWPRRRPPRPAGRADGPSRRRPIARRLGSRWRRTAPPGSAHPRRSPASASPRAWRPPGDARSSNRMTGRSGPEHGGGPSPSRSARAGRLPRLARDPDRVGRRRGRRASTGGRRRRGLRDRAGGRRGRHPAGALARAGRRRCPSARRNWAWRGPECHTAPASCPGRPARLPSPLAAAGCGSELNPTGGLAGRRPSTAARGGLPTACSGSRRPPARTSGRNRPICESADPSASLHFLAGVDAKREDARRGDHDRALCRGRRDKPPKREGSRNENRTTSESPSASPGSYRNRPLGQAIPGRGRVGSRAGTDPASPLTRPRTPRPAGERLRQPLAAS